MFGNQHWNRVPKEKLLALYGFGGIGKEIAKRAVPFKMNVIYYCRHPNLEDEKTYGVKYVDEETLLREETSFL